MIRYRTLPIWILFAALASIEAGAQSPAKRDLIIFIDGTSSVDQARMTDALNHLRESVPAIARLFTSVRVGIFSDEGPFTRIGAPIEIPARSLPKNCSATAAEIPRMDLAGIFPGIKEYRENLKARECAALNRALEQKQNSDLGIAIRKIRSSIPESITPKRTCTDIVGLLRHILSSTPPGKSTVILISDGEETCIKDPIQKIQVPGGWKVLLFLVPKNGSIEKEGPAALKRGEIWQASIPELIVHPYTGISETIANSASE